jgi:hypothetical protein
MGEKPNTNTGFILKKHVQSYKVKKSYFNIDFQNRYCDVIAIYHISASRPRGPFGSDLTNCKTEASLQAHAAQRMPSACHCQTHQLRHHGVLIVSIFDQIKPSGWSCRHLMKHQDSIHYRKHTPLDFTVLSSPICKYVLLKTFKKITDGYLTPSSIIMQKMRCNKNLYKMQ